jgi:hypothetical protein
MIDRNALSTAKSSLISKGWTHTHSITRTPGSKDYGLCFIKDGAKFYLNVETISEVEAL